MNYNNDGWWDVIEEYNFFFIFRVVRFNGINCYGVYCFMLEGLYDQIISSCKL